MSTAPEFWLRGPVPGIDPLLMPAAHALLQARADIESATADVTDAEVWRRIGAAAPAGFHLRHIAGSLDRLFTYARGEALEASQRDALAREQRFEGPAAELVDAACAAIDRAMAQLGATPPSALHERREVGRGRLPATVLGLLFHGAEHTTRHVGQLITTLRAGRGAGS